MKTRVWFMAPLVLGVLLGCSEKQIGKVTNLVDAVVATQGEDSAVGTNGKQVMFSDSVAQEITAMDDYFSTLKTSREVRRKKLSKKEQQTLKSAKDISQEGKVLQMKGQSYRALQKIRTVKKLMKPMMKKFWKISDKRAILGLVNQQIGVVKQRGQELEDLVAPGKVKSRKVVNAHQRSKVLFGEAKKLRNNGKLRGAYVQSEEALEVLDTAIAAVWRDRSS